MCYNFCMSSFVAEIKNKPFSLVVEIPSISSSFLQAAYDNGADFVRIKPLSFYDLQNAKDALKISKLLMGLDLMNIKEKIKIKDVQKFSFLTFPFHARKNQKLENIRLPVILRLSTLYSLDEIVSMKKNSLAVLEADIVPKPGWGREMINADLQNYISIALASKTPVLVPTQRNLLPSEMAILWDAGIKGVVLTSEFLGNDIEQFENKLQAFSSAIKEL